MEKDLQVGMADKDTRRHYFEMQRVILCVIVP